MTYTEPPLFVSGNTLTAAQLNLYVRDNWKNVADAWTAYTPSLSTWALGNGTIVGAYVKVGRLVHFRLRFDAGSTSTFVGSPVFGLPVAAISSFSLPVGQALLADDSGTSATFRATRTALINSATNLVLRAENGALLSATVPWTWATNDIIEIAGTYQAAS